MIITEKQIDNIINSYTKEDNELIAKEILANAKKIETAMIDNIALEIIRNVSDENNIVLDKFQKEYNSYQKQKELKMNKELEGIIKKLTELIDYDKIVDSSNDNYALAA